jgi:hypothetical protein
MPMLEVSASGDFKNTKAFLASMKTGQVFDILERYGEIGRQALADATPVESGLTAASWTYEVVQKKGSYQIIWHNTNVVEGVPVAVLIQYGHATGTGGWVEGRDYINPAIQPLFDKIANEVWEKVKRA